MSVGIFFHNWYSSHLLKSFFLNHYSKMCHFTNVELKTKALFHITIIHVKYIREFFGNFNIPRFLGTMLEM